MSDDKKQVKDLRIKILASIPFLTEEEEDTDA